MFDVPVSKIFLSEHNPISDLELSIFERYFKISLYLRFLYSGFSLFYLTSFKLKLIFGLILFLKDIDIIFLFKATLNKWL